MLKSEVTLFLAFITLDDNADWIIRVNLPISYNRVHCGRSIRCVKAEVGDETRERGWDLDPELVPMKKRVLKDFKKEKDDLIYVLERLLWLLGEGG